MKLKILILMTVSMIVITAHFLIVPVHGQVASVSKDTLVSLDTLMILEGKVDDGYYEVEGYVIIQNNVCSEVAGSYEIVYQSIADEMIYTRKVIVISRDNKEYFDIETCKINTFKDYPMILEKSVSLNSEEQILLVRYITNKEKNIGHLYMYYLRNSEIIKEVQLFYNQQLEVNDVLVNGSEFVIIGRIWDSLYANYDIVFVVCDKNGLRKCSKLIGGTGTDTGITGMILEDGYLVMGVTDSSDSEFEGNKKENTFIMKINKTSYEVENVEYYTYYETIYKTKMINTSCELYLLNTLSSNEFELVQINNAGKKLKNKKFSLDFNVSLKEVYTEDTKINVILEKEKGFEVGIIDLNGYNMVFEKDSNKIISCVYNDQVLTFLYQLEDGYKFEVLNKEFSKIYEKDIYQTFSSHNLEFKNQVLFEDLTSSGCINIHKISYLKILTLGKDVLDNNSNNDYNDYQVIINGKNQKHTGYIDNIDFDTFGNYDIVYYFDSTLDLIMSKTFKVPLNSEIKPGNIYDLGISISHNGVAYLNDVRIESGHVINEEGSYTLEVVGKNEAREIINFEVKNLSIKQEVVEKSELMVETIIETDDIRESVLDCKVVLSEDEAIKKINNVWDFMYAVPAMLALGVAFMIIKMKY